MHLAGNKLVGIFNIVIYSIGCMSATIIFLCITSFLSKYIKKFINVKVLKLIDYAVGIISICFAIRVALG